MEPLKGTSIWDLTRIPDRTEAEINRIEFPSLVRFKGAWYCSFREGAIHNNHPSGRGRILKSEDGVSWETAVVLDWEGADVREPKLSITAEGWLMANTHVYFVSKEPRVRHNYKPGTLQSFTPADAKRTDDVPDRYYQLDWLGTVLNLSPDDLEQNVACQSVTWLSPDGENWSSAYACPTGVNTWRWDVTWHNGMGYSLAQWGAGMDGPLYRTRDGKSWRVLVQKCPPEGKCNEGSLAFGRDDTAYCVLRTGKGVLLGSAPAPYYQNWTWQEPRVNYGPEYEIDVASKVLRVGFGGPKLITLRDGRLVVAGRALGPGRDDGRATLFLVDPAQGIFKFIGEFDGTSYPGIVEHEGQIWVTYVGSACHHGTWEIHLGKIDIPPVGEP